MSEGKRNTVIRVEHLNKQFLVDKRPVEVLRDINLEIKEGEFITIVGHSGCGKSTLLRIICGLTDYEDGIVERNDHKVDGPGPQCGMVFQNHRLLPWLKIKDNVAFALDQVPQKEKDEIVQQHIEMVGLAGFENSYPAQLSGGMSQRAAIARGLVNNPRILLLDEPFGALDALTRIQMQKEILKIKEKQNTTMVMVTHDIDEAIFLGDRIVVMSARPGQILDVLKVTAAGHQRNSRDFDYYKKKIYDYLFGAEAELDTDYVI